MNNWKFGLALIAVIALLAILLRYGNGACENGQRAKIGGVVAIGRC